MTAEFHSEHRPAVPDAGPARLAGRRFRSRLALTDEAIRDHLVHGVPVLPGVFLLDLVVRGIAGTGVDPATVELRRCVFLTPVSAVDGVDRELLVELGEPAAGGDVPVVVRSRQLGADADTGWRAHCTAQVRVGPPWRPARVDTAVFTAASGGTTDAAELYGLLRRIQILHRGFMRAEGSVRTGPAGALAEVRLGPAAQQHRDDFLVHPVVLDFATLVPLWLLPPEDRAGAEQPFVPIAVESFRSVARPAGNLLVHVPGPVRGGLTGETLAADITVCDADGRPVGALTGFRAKRIRAADHLLMAADRPVPPAPAAGPVERTTADTGAGTAPAPADTGAGTAPAAGTGDPLGELVAGLVAGPLGLDPAAVDPRRGFYELGLTSVDLLGVVRGLESALGVELYPTLLFEHPTVQALTDHLQAEGASVPEPVPAEGPSSAAAVPPPTQPPPPAALPALVPAAPSALVPLPAADDPGPLAVVGLAGRYPGARNLDQLWDLLCEGRDLVTAVPDGRWPGDLAGMVDPALRRGAFLDGVDEFDPLFFALSPRQAALLDPHERLFLQAAWAAVEDAGHVPEGLAGEVGVFVGVMWSDYQLYGAQQAALGNLEVTGSWFSGIANRVSYAMDFRGPSLAVDTACSSSLAALHLAAESIRRGECRTAVVGGVNLSLHPYKYLRLEQLGLLSRRGACRPFSAAADGYVPGEGVGALVLRPLADALADGDHVYGLLRGSALRHGGHAAGFTVPSPEAQRQVVTAALAAARVPPATVSYVEAQGSATTIADRIEVEALAAVYGAGAGPARCPLGSIKANLGHLEAASGMAGLTKVLLALRHGWLPPTPGVQEPNPDIAFDRTPFRLLTEGEAWPAAGADPGGPGPRRAALSSFGAGGANVHLIVEEHAVEAPADRRPAPDDRGPVVVPLSARTDDRLRVQAAALADHLRRHPDLPAAAVAGTLQHGRRPLECRLAVVADDVPALIAALDEAAAGRSTAAVHTGRVRAGTGGRPVPGPPIELAEAWVRGDRPNWPGPAVPQRVPLPPYPFEPRRCWLTGTATAVVPRPAPPGGSGPDAALRDGTAVTRLYRPSWQPAAPATGAAPPTGPLLVFDRDGQWTEALRHRGARVVRVRPGSQVARTAAEEYEVDPDAPEAFAALRDALAADGVPPVALLHLWTLPAADAVDGPAGLLTVLGLCRAWLAACPRSLPVLHAARGSQQPTDAAVAGLARCVRLEQPKLPVGTVWLAPGGTPADDADALLAELAELAQPAAPTAVEVRYGPGGREVLRFGPVAPEPAEGPPLVRDGGVYLVTGGTGGLGRLVARHLATSARGVRLALVGRSPLPADRRALLTDLENAGARVRYLRADVSRRSEAAAAVARAEAELGPLTGVLHAAGVRHDALVGATGEQAVLAALATKLDGAYCLDLATRHAELDHLLLFSSVSGVLGSVGQAGYAAANRALDAFASWRDELRTRGERSGRTVSVAWPLWRDGGMQPDPAAGDRALATAGLRPLDTADGLAVLDRAPALGPQLVVLHGDPEQLERRLDVVAGPAEPARPARAAALERELAGVFADVLQVEVDELDPHDDLADYGVDSVTALRVLERLERRYGVALPPSTLAADRSLLGLARRLAEVVADLEPVPATGAGSVPPAAAPEQPAPGGPAGRPPPAHPGPAVPGPAAPPPGNRPDAGGAGARRVAVVALAGRYPGAGNLDELWELLAGARDAVTEVPAGRWAATPAVPVPRWGGFLASVDEFDPDLLGIDDSAAAWLDPHQRLCLELAQELVDGAGYRRDELAGRSVGVFLGVAPSDHVRRNLLAGLPAPDGFLPGGLPNLAAAALSQVWDLAGPAMVIDTACSSSLVALHRACQSVSSGESELAIAGGCHLLLDPFAQLTLARAGLLSDDGRTRVFDRAASGLGLGEGAGLVLLKDEELARRDGDRVLAVILGGAVNNDGRTLGLTTPSHRAQVALLDAALGSAGISADTVDYLEVNGSASGFGDPLEVHAAAEAFRRHTGRRQFCRIGSVKSNLGHLLHASGVAAFTKVVLALQRGTLPATVHLDDPHPRLRFPETPFVPVTRAEPWRPRPDRPRRAGISSFGFGGTNCHLLVEEAPAGYRARRDPLPPTRLRPRPVPLPPRPPAAAVAAVAAVSAAEPPDLAAAVTDHLLARLAGLVDAEAGGAPTAARTFAELGLTSADLVRLDDQLEEDFGITLPPTAFFRHPRPSELAGHLVADHAAPLADWWRRRAAGTAGTVRPAGSAAGRGPDAPPPARGAGGPEPAVAAPGRPVGAQDVAVIGMAGVFPGAADLDALWAALVAGRDLVSEVPPDRWDHRLVYDPDERPGTTACRHGGFLPDVSAFDARFFGVLPAEAAAMDPQLRLLLQVLYSAAEDAAALPRLRGSATGVFVGRCFHDYDDESAVRARPLGGYDTTGLAVSMTANRPSSWLDLTGPSLTVDTACSSSLYALDLAVAALRRGECGTAFAAGTNLLLSPRHYLRLAAIGALSPSGRCHAFDARADGYVPGEAVVAVLLKPLKRALADGDPVHAVIKSVAVNHGGRASSITAPQPARQTSLLLRAWADAGIDPATLGYLEAHGTGTALGDPIEVEAAAAAFAAHTDRRGFCALGTAKAHLGHTEGAAGLTGLVKAVLQMRHGVIPAMPDLREVNPYCRLADGPFRIPRQTEPWSPPAGLPRRAGVSSFGFGGANAHVVVEEPPARPPAAAPSGPLVFPFSALDGERLRAVCGRHRAALAAGGAPVEVAETLQHGRDPLPVRAAVVAADRPGLLAGLDALLDGDAPGRVVAAGGDDGAEAVALARRWVAGDSVPWPPTSAARVPLPTYPFAVERHPVTDRADPPAGGGLPVGGGSRPAPAPAPAPVPLTAGQAPADPAARAAAALAGHLARSDYPGERVSAGLRRLDELSRRLLRRVLADWTGEPTPTEAAVLARVADLGTYAPFARAAVAAAGRAVPGAADDDPARLDAELHELVAAAPEVAAYADLIQATLPAVPDVLAGRRDALEVYFPAEGAELLARIYRGNPISDHHNDLVAHAVAGYLDQRRRAGADRLRVLEVGAGTGGTTRPVLELLGREPDGLEYVFTDVSVAFLGTAERDLAAHPVDLRYARFDLAADPEAQGLPVGGVDVVVAANVVHAVPDVAAALRRLRRLLTDGGLLVLNEVTGNGDHLTAMIGMIPGWAAGAGQAGRLPGSPLLDVPTWSAALAAAGFDAVWPFSRTGVEPVRFEHAVLVCRAGSGAESSDAESPGAGTGAGPAGRPPVAVPASGPVGPRDADPGAPAPDLVTAVRDYLRQLVGDFLRVPPGALADDSPLERHGLDSLAAVQLARTLQADFGPLPKVLLYEHPTIDALAVHLASRDPAVARAVGPAPPRPAVAPPVGGRDDPDPDDDLVVTGMAVTVPGAADLRSFWRNLSEERDLVTEIPPDRFDWREVYRPGDPTRQPGTTNSRWGGFVEGADRFDAAFFDISPLEAELMDPQQRLFLQAAWRAVEDSGRRVSDLRGGRTGVFVGATAVDYHTRLTRIGRDTEAHAPGGNAHCVLANRVSFQLDLHGPSETVDTACSSSLTALHRAVSAVRAGECDAAIVGGVHLSLVSGPFVAFGQLGMLSADGRCKTFSATADGFVRGEGVIALLVERRRDAVAAGVPLRAVVRGTGVNHGGRVSSLTVPSPAAQADLVVDVHRRAGVDPRTVGYVEAHGTGTLVGDPIEVRGLKRAFAELTGVPVDAPVEPWCGLGTVKSNVGHLEAAAGLAGVVKAVLSLQHGTIPATLHVDGVNPLLEVEGSPFEVATATRPWPAPRDHLGRPVPRRAAVSSFGFGGANAHVVLEEAVPAAGRPAAEPATPQLVVLSARTPERLSAYAAALLADLDARHAAGEPAPLADLAFTLQAGRDAFTHRLALVATGTGELRDALRGLLAGVPPATAVVGAADPVVDPGPQPEAAVPPGTVEEALRWARRWVGGAEVPWPQLHGGPRRRLNLPGYPFEPVRHWADPAPGRAPTEHPGPTRQEPGPTPPDQRPAPAGPGPAADGPDHAAEAGWTRLLDDLRRGTRSVADVDRLLTSEEERR